MMIKLYNIHSDIIYRTIYLQELSRIFLTYFLWTLGQPTPYPSMPINQHIGIGWRQRLSYAKDMLRICESEHEDCHIKSPLYLPTRILDLCQTNLYPDIVMIETRYQSPRRYACLSHCWGNSQPLRTTKANFQDMKTWIPWSSLPQSFQDAIFVARELKMDYLWIDSLCIIQDDPDDWAVESSMMADIYGNASITIAASVAENSHAGFLRDADPTFEFTEIRGEGHGGTEFSIYVRASRSHVGYTDIARADRGSQNPLGQRAWAFQEYLLSPRLLQFGPTEVIWACNHEIDCECQRMKGHYSNKSGFTHAMDIEREDFAASDAVSWWSAMMDEYMHRGLSFESDRLVALSGVAKLMQSALRHSGFPHGYFAGLWQTDFTQQLGWCVDSPFNRPTTYRAPSWSWASLQPREHESGRRPELNGSGVTHWNSNTMIASVVDIHCTTTTSDPTGAISDGFLMLSSIVLEATLRHNPHTSQNPYSCYIKLLDSETATFHLDTAEDYIPNHPYFCLMLGEVHARTGFFYILVCRSVSPQNDCFIRVGLARNFHHSTFAEVFREKVLELEPAHRRVVKII